MVDGLSGLPSIGQLVDRFRIVSLLGRGGMAAVFAVSRSGAGGFEKLLAMKTVLPHLAGDPNVLSMFLDEGRLASRIQHRNVVQVFDVGQNGDLPFLVMELLAGRNVAALARAGAMPVEIALAILAQAAEGLHAAHELTDDEGVSLGLVHRDVSPQNIFVCASGDVKVLDFGIAAARGRLSATRTGEIKGKLRYLAPEQITRARDVTRAADLWALGVVAWELLSGRRLFEDSDSHEASTLWSVVEAPIAPIAESAPLVPRAACEIIDRCLDRDPSRRPATAREVAAVLGTVARELGGDVTTIAAHVERLCGAELAEERAALVSASRVLPAPQAARAEDVVFTTVTVAASTPRSRVSGRVKVLLPVTVVALAAALTFTSLRGRGPAAAQPGTSPSTITSDVPASVESSPPAAVEVEAPAPVAVESAPRRVPKRAPRAAASASTVTPLFKNPF